MKAVTINAFWSADAAERAKLAAGNDTTAITVVSDTKVDKGDGAGKVNGKITDCG